MLAQISVCDGDFVARGTGLMLLSWVRDGRRMLERADGAVGGKQARGSVVTEQIGISAVAEEVAVLVVEHMTTAVADSDGGLTTGGAAAVAASAVGGARPTTPSVTQTLRRQRRAAAAGAASDLRGGCQPVAVGRGTRQPDAGGPEAERAYGISRSRSAPPSPH